MPRYYFEFGVDGRFGKDDEGLEFADLDGVRSELRRSLPTIMAENEDWPESVIACERDETGKAVMAATICLVILPIDSDLPVPI